MTLDIKKNISLKNISTFSIGGPSKYYVSVKNREELKEIFLFIKEKKLPYFIVGNGSNLLFDDQGFDGLIIHNKIMGMNIKGNYLSVGAGELLPKVISYLSINNYSSLEHLSGIPASIGGALFMNAGANGSNVYSCLKDVTFMHESGDIELFNATDIQFAYRKTSFQNLKGAIVEATFNIKEDASVKKLMKKHLEKRMKSQPYASKSAGCVFRNPKDNFAGALIEKCGLKGQISGGAKVSDIHANFIVNEKYALSKDVKSLISMIKKTVKEKYCIDLEEEIQYVPYSK